MTAASCVLRAGSGDLDPFGDTEPLTDMLIAVSTRSPDIPEAASMPGDSSNLVSKGQWNYGCLIDVMTVMM